MPRHQQPGAHLTQPCCDFNSKPHLIFPKKNGVEIDGQKIFLVKKYLAKEILGKIILGSKNVLGQKNVCQKNFG